MLIKSFLPYLFMLDPSYGGGKLAYSAVRKGCLPLPLWEPVFFSPGRLRPAPARETGRGSTRISGQSTGLSSKPSVLSRRKKDRQGCAA